MRYKKMRRGQKPLDIIQIKLSSYTSHDSPSFYTDSLFQSQTTFLSFMQMAMYSKNHNNRLIYLSQNTPCCTFIFRIGSFSRLYRTSKHMHFRTDKRIVLFLPNIFFTAINLAFILLLTSHAFWTAFPW